MREALCSSTYPGSVPDLEIVLEVAPKRAFACALWFPGWFGHGGTPDAAIERLLSYRERYLPIADRVTRRLPPASSLTVVEELVGDSTTEYGAPGQVAGLEWHVSELRLRGLRALQAACRDHLVEIAGAAPEALRKGSRGGGRDTSKILDHVAEAEKAYASKLRREVWPEAYYLRRSGYHCTDHAWEIQDRTPT